MSAFQFTCVKYSYILTCDVVVCFSIPDMTFSVWLYVQILSDDVECVGFHVMLSMQWPP